MDDSMKEIAKTFNHLNNIIQLNALRNLLIEKGIITFEEYSKSLSEQVNLIEIDGMRKLLKQYYRDNFEEDIEIS